MSKKQHVSIGRGIVILTGVTFSARFGAIILNFILIKILRPDQLGLFLGVQAMVYAGCAFCDLGLSQGYRMLVSRDHSFRQPYLGTTLCVQAIALFLYLLGLSGHLSLKGMLTFPVVLITIGALISQWVAIAEIDLQIFRNFGKSSILILLPVLSLAGATLLCFLSHDRLYGLAIGYALGMIVTGVIAVVLLGSGVWQTKFNRKYLFLVRTSILFFFSILFYRIGQFWGLSFVLISQGEHVAGILGLPIKLYQMVLILSVVTTGVTLPLFHKLSQLGDYEQLGVVLGRLLGPLWAVAGTVAGLCILCPKLIVDILASREYMDSVPLIPILGVSLLVKTLAVPAGNILECRNLQWLRLVGQAISTTALVISIIILLPIYGILAVAIAILCVDCFLYLWYWGFNILKIGRVLPWGVQLRAIISFVVASGVSWILPRGEVNKVVLFVFTYLCFLNLFRVLNFHDLLNLMRAKR